MPVSAVGVSHHLIPLEDLAQLGQVTQPSLAELDAAELPGLVLLSTCNRFEVYFESESFHGGLELVLGALRRSLPEDHRALVDQFQVYAGQAAVQHLLEVTSGLDSMVVGEAEIIGQVREALAASGDRASASLHRLFHAALTTAKAVTSQTDLGAAGRSIAQVGLDLVEQRHFALAGRTALVVGTGSYARVVTATLQRRGCTDILVWSSTDRAGRFAESHPVRPVPMDGLADALAAADLLVTCSGSEGSTGAGIDAGLLTRARSGLTALLPVLDLSLSGDVAPDAGDLLFVDLIDLEEIGAHAPAGQTAAVLAARDLVNRGVETYLHLEQGRAATPAVTAMRAHVSQFIEREIEAAARRYDPDTAAAVARSLRRVSNALLHTPSLRAAELARTGELADYSHALQTLFGIEVEADA
ncbi:MAG: glutamyl-tRNA reductase [Propionicimonas sp.]|uniref:glutamyl-tRNA reductase n=1 Tax=Propionicimonas sp. TaxID=1955623 RepID=UPI003D0AAA9F